MGIFDNVESTEFRREETEKVIFHVWLISVIFAEIENEKEKVTLNWWWKVLDIVCWRTEMTNVSCWLSPPESVAWVDDFFYCLGGWQIDQLPGWCLPGRSRRWSSRDWHIWCMIFHWCGPWHHICIFIYLNSEVVEADVFFEGQKENFLARGRKSRPTQVVQCHSSVPGGWWWWLWYVNDIYLIYRNDICKYIIVPNSSRSMPLQCPWWWWLWRCVSENLSTMLRLRSRVSPSSKSWSVN